MRIVYATDIHDAYAAVDRLLRVTSADLFVLAGDLIYKAFHRLADLERFTDLQYLFLPKLKAAGWPGTIDGFATVVLSSEGQPEELAALAEEYLRLAARARQTMLRKYGKFAEILESHGDKQIVVIPGNYDMDLQETPLAKWDLHKKAFEYHKLRIAGYGGAPVFTPGIPESLQVPYVECTDDVNTTCELTAHLLESRPHLLIVHQPPHGMLDTLPSYGSVGSHALRRYVDETQVPVVLSGHIHEAWGVETSLGTVCVNPSAFGKTLSATRTVQGGYFFDFYIEEQFYVIGTLRQLRGETLIDLADYTFSGGSIHEIVIDYKKLRYLQGIPAKRARHIWEINTYNKLKDFFTSYETDESRARILELRRLYRELREQGTMIAFDVLGSVNLGLAEVASDIDVVVYWDRRDGCWDGRDADGFDESAVERLVADLAPKYRLHVCDTLDLCDVDHAANAEDPLDDTLQRFAFYRAIGRPVNLRMIRPVEIHLMEHSSLQSDVEEQVREYLQMLVHDSSHVRSFQKYQSRVLDMGFAIPEGIADSVRAYLRESSTSGA